MSGIQIIAGLGNPGPAYANTRHNAGFWFVDHLAREHGGSFSHEARFHGEVARIQVAGTACWLIKPATFMNRSGQAVAALAGFYKIPVAQLLVVHDELDMMPGQAKLKLGGGVAGHNGLKDIRARCGSADFWRLRLGIGHPRELGLRQPVVDFVLRPPSDDDLAQIDRGIEAGLAAVPELISGAFEAGMLRLHTAVGKPTRPGKDD